MTDPAPSTEDVERLAAEFDARAAEIDRAIGHVLAPGTVLRETHAAAMLRALAAERDRLMAEMARLRDPDAVHVNMLRGSIAKPSLTQIMHIYPEITAERDRLARALREIRHETGRARGEQSHRDAARAAFTIAAKALAAAEKEAGDG